MKKGIIAALLFSFILVFPTQAQKIREKKDIVYVDGTPLYKFYRTKGDWKTVEDESVFTTLSDDTLVWVRGRRLSMPKTSYEKLGNLYEDYRELHFAGSDSILLYDKPDGILYEDIVEAGVLKDGKLDLSALPAFKLELARYLVPLQHLQKAMDNRQKLSELPIYKHYVKQLSNRFPSDILHVGPPNIIFYQSKVGGSSEKIGFYEVRPIERGVEYRIFRMKDKGYVASILHEPRTGIVFIKTDLDKASFDYTIIVPFDNAVLENALLYLTEYGYL